MNKFLIGASILLGSILIVENFVLAQQAQIIIWYSDTGTLSIFGIILGVMLGYGLKGILNEKSTSEYDDEGLNF